MAIAAALFGPMQQAAAVTYQYDFTVDWEAGPSFGSFTFDVDASLVPAGGGYVSGLLIPSDFSLTINGHQVDESTARIGFLGFDAAGTMNYAVFGNDCDHGCSVGGAGPLEWSMAFWTTTPRLYPYSNVNGILTAYEGDYHSPSRYAEKANVFAGHVTPPAVVPEPQAVALLLAGLGVVLVARRAAGRK